MGFLSPIEARPEHLLCPDELFKLDGKIFVLHGYQVGILPQSTHLILLVVALLDQSLVRVFG